MRAWLRKLAGRAGKASRGKRGASSHVNTRRNKRASSKAVRTSYRAQCARQIDTFAEDHHLDIPEELYMLHDEEPF